MTLHVAKDGQGIWLALLMLDSFTARLLSEGSRSYGAASHPADAEGAATGRSARSARSAHSAVSARSTGGGGSLS